MRWLAGVLAVAGLAQAAIDLDSPLANMYCFGIDKPWTAKMNNTNAAGNFSDIARPLFGYTSSYGDPINGGYCLQADIPRKGRFLYNCEHPSSNIVVWYDGKNTVKIAGNLVRCNTQWTEAICRSQIPKQICTFDFTYPVRPDKVTNRLLGDVKGKPGGGTVTCGKEVTEYIGNNQERFLTLAGKAFEKGDHGFGWVYQPNSIDPDVSDRRGDWVFSLICPPDENECATGTHKCDDNAQCTNNLGSYSCACNSGYNGDGVKCKVNKQPINGRVLNDANRDNKPEGDNGYLGVTVNARDEDGNILATVKTDVNGYFRFDLEPGLYQIQVELPNGKIISYSPEDADQNTLPLDVQPETTYDGIVFGLRDNTQYVSGRVLEDVTRDGKPDNDPGVASIKVDLIGAGGNVVSSTVTDGSGGFRLEAPPGDYTVKITMPTGKVIAYDISGKRDGTAPITIEQNTNLNGVVFGLRDATQSVTGRILNDANRDGSPTGDAGFPGVTVNVVDAGGKVLATTRSDASGNFKIDIVPGTYTIQAVLPTGKVISYAPTGANGGNSAPLVVPQNTNVNGITFGLRDASQTVSGRILNDANRDGAPTGDAGSAGVVVSLLDSTGRIISQATTDGTGNFRLEAPPGQYTVRVSLPSGKVISYDTSGTKDGTAPVTIQPSTNVNNIVFGLRDATQTVTGKVNDDANRDGSPTGDNGLAGITVNIVDSTGKTVATVKTDANGNWKADIVPGSYTIQVVLPTGKVISYAPTGASGNSAPLNVVPGTNYDGIVFGLRDATQTVSGRVQNDANRDGRPEGDAGVAGIAVAILDMTNKVIAQTTTDANGNFKMDVVPGTYTVKMTLPSGKVIAYDISGNKDGTAPITVQSNTNYNGVVFGIRDATQTITGRVLDDVTHDGRPDNDPGFRGITVNLVNAAGQIVGTVQTDTNGVFTFEAVPGTYTVRIAIPTGKRISYAPTGSTNGAMTINLPAGSNVNGVIFGLCNDTQIVQGNVRSDNNRDGKPDNDPGLAGITVRAIDSTGRTVATTTSADNGSWRLDLQPGTYSVRIVSPVGKVVSYDPDGTPDGTAAITVRTGTNINGIEFGLRDASEGVITGKVIVDENLDGKPTGDSKPVPGATVVALDDNGREVARTTTDANGNYRFEKLAPGPITVQVKPPANFAVSYDGDDEPDGSFDLTVTNGVPASHVFGLKPTTGNIAGLVLRDQNSDGLPSGDPAYPNLPVQLLDARGTVVQTTTSDANGRFSFTNVPSGTYTVKAVLPDGTIISYQTGNTKDGSIPLTVPAGQTVSVTFGLRDSSCSISGFVFREDWDEGYNSIRVPVPNVIVRLIDEAGNVVRTTRTNAQGKYFFENVPAGTYTVRMETPDGFVVSFDPDKVLDGQAKVTVTPGQKQEVNFGIKPATGHIKGRVVDDKNLDRSPVNDAPTAGVRVQLLDRTGAVLSVTTTDAKGEFLFPDMAVGTYSVRVLVPAGKSISFAPDGSTRETIPVNLIYGVETNYIYGLRPAGADVGGKINTDSNRDGKPDGDPGAPGVIVQLIDPATGNVIQSTTTGPDGTYKFPNVPQGNYCIRIVTPAGQEVSYQPAGATNGQSCITVTPGKPIEEVYGFKPIGNIVSGRVNQDANYDGRPENDPGAPGVTVQLLGPAGQILQTVTTDTNGQFVFRDVVAGGYSVKVVTPANNVIAYGPVGSQSGQGSITVTAGNPITAITYGIRQNGASVSGKVTTDNNRDGRPDGDPAAPGVTVRLLDPQGNVVSTTTTGPDGTYNFPFVPAGQYVVEVVPTPGTQFSYQPNGSNNGRLPITINPGQPVQGSFGVKTIGTTVSGKVNRDLNHDGTPTGDSGTPGVTVELVDRTTGQVIKSTTTDASGSYLFSDIPAGQYQVRVIVPPGTTLAYQPAGAQNGVAPISVTAGTPVNNVTFGLKPIGSPVSGIIKTDNNRDGQPNGDPGAPGVTVQLLDPQGKVVDTTTTGPDGRYTFPNVPIGTYTIKVVPSPNTEISYQPIGSNNGEMPIRVEPNNPITADFGIKTQGTTISGKVNRDQNFDGKPLGDPGLAGVTVQLLDPNTKKPIAVTTTDYDGSFQFTDVPAGNYIVNVLPPGSMTFSYQPPGSTNGAAPVPVRPGVPMNNLIYGLRPGTQDITGSVLLDADRNGDPDSDGPAPNVVVQLLDRNGKVLTSTTTDEEGQYRFQDVPAGDYVLKVVAPANIGFSYEPQGSSNGVLPIKNVPGTPIDSTFGLSASNSAKVVGMVWLDEAPFGNPDGDEAGVAGVIVTLTDIEGITLADVATDAKGNYEFTELPPGDYTVAIEPPTGYDVSYDPSDTQTGTADVTTTNDAPGEAVFGVRNAAVTITGSVREDSNGDRRPENDPGLGGIPVRLVDPTGKLIATTTTAPDGSFKFPDVPAGKYTIKVDVPPGRQIAYQPAGGSANGEVPVTVVPGNPLQVTYGLTPATSTVSGKVNDDANRDGSPTGDAGEPGVTVQLLDPTGKIVQTTTTGPDGTFTFPNVPAGTYSVKVVPTPNNRPFSYQPTGSNNGVAPITVAPGTPINAVFGLRPASEDLSGRVLSDENRDGRPDNDRPVAGVTVRLLDPEGQVVRSTTTGPDGSYRFKDVPYGSYTVKLDIPAGMEVAYEPDSNVDGSVPVTVGPNQAPATTFGIRPRQDGSVTVTIVSDDRGTGSIQTDSKPIRGVSVALVNPTTGATISTLNTDETGKVTFPNLVPGTYRVQVTPPRGSTHSFDADGTPDGRTQVTVQPGTPATTRFGLRRIAESTIVVSVQIDKDRSGAPNPTNPPASSVKVKVQDETGATIATQTTNSTGRVEFSRLPAGRYMVVIEPPLGNEFSFDPDGIPDGLSDVLVDVSSRAIATFGIKVNGVVCERQVCHINAQCAALGGGYGGSTGKACRCNAGYQGDGVACADVNECQGGLSPCRLANTVCANSIGSFTCDCRSGFALLNGACVPANCTSAGYGASGACSASSAKTYEVGALNVDSKWRSVTFKTAFDVIPVVIAGPAGTAGANPAEVIVRDVTNLGFKLRIQEPSCFDNDHVLEAVAWIAVRPDSQFDFGGSSMLATRAQVVVNRNFTMKYTAITRTPAVFGQVQDQGDGESVVVRPARVGRTQLEVVAQGNPETANRQQVIIGVLMVEASTGAIARTGGPSVRFAAGTVEGISSAFTTVRYPNAGFVATAPPVVLASLWYRDPTFGYVRHQARRADLVTLRGESPLCPVGEGYAQRTGDRVSYMVLRPATA